jgi:hypothetical protein
LICLASLKTIFVDKAENILALLKLIEQIPTLKRIVLTKKLSDDKETEIRSKAKEVNIEIMTYNQLRVNILTRFCETRSKRSVAVEIWTLTPTVPWKHHRP